MVCSLRDHANVTTTTVTSLPVKDNGRLSPSEQLRLLGNLELDRRFAGALESIDLYPLIATGIEVMQINVGKMCNQTCHHCHVDAGPNRTEIMTRETMEQCVAALAAATIPTVDITGGAPELNPHFRWLVERCTQLGRHVIDRCNLTILLTGPGAGLPEFLACHRVEVICSLPHYGALNTDRQRGEGVFDKSIKALQLLNDVGYGDGKNGLRLVLVTNPSGAYLPPRQESAEAEWKEKLKRRYGIRFDALYTITNVPINRYIEFLIESGNIDRYMQELVAAFNPQAARGVMCRSMVSVGWDGWLYDCDFNQMLEVGVEGRCPRHIRDFDEALLRNRTIAVNEHCFGCTAGQGSSCGGKVA